MMYFLYWLALCWYYVIDSGDTSGNIWKQDEFSLILFEELWLNFHQKSLDLNTSICLLYGVCFLDNKRRNMCKEPTYGGPEGTLSEIVVKGNLN